MRILVADGLDPEGVALLRTEAEVDVPAGLTAEALPEAIRDADAVVVRSRTRITEAVLRQARRLRVVARAGVGVDNIDVEAATRRGILVLNAPDSSTVSTAEHTLAMLLALARKIPAAHAAAAAGHWSRERFTGIELHGKTLGIVGLGRIGGEVARRAQAFGMRVVACDPFVTAERAERLDVELVSWEDLLERSDIVTLHVPLTERTRHLIDRAALARLRRGALIVNCARGGLIDEEALLAALEEGHIGGAALDVFEDEPPGPGGLRAHPRVVLTPHLGASTAEAQRRIGLEVAGQVLAALAGRPVRGAVNAPTVPEETWQRLGPYLELAGQLGRIARQLGGGQVRQVELSYEGEIASWETEWLRAAFLRSLLASILDEPVNLINATVLAQERGIALGERRDLQGGDFSTLLRVRVVTTADARTLAGTVFGRRDPRVVFFDGYRIDLVPAPFMLWIWNEDRPGMIGKVGTLLGNADVNIASMQVGRDAPRGRAVMVLGLDDPVPEELLEALRRIDGIVDVRPVYG
ncbi:MAG: phosphoglycerate dehydrogenase [Armatimonadota bacterium]|nr:phosphoglycerate dehydrogenase [Armatimonadota bacterium]MDR7451496.1 phosphoglycerate dehydrogenase [Armatimonadota bacterium]MDR7467463.1 phosphoglycerate dehydrogenase [Armatimonadota bacterium]MDR7494337.1 phosphoglycerate dehydrogenase [Armatimonadota bacterium]MDR7499154.1 phosphoglycerate dehydrogenase [Armatimonadota bacterium]